MKDLYAPDRFLKLLNQFITAGEIVLVGSVDHLANLARRERKGNQTQKFKRPSKKGRRQ